MTARTRTSRLRIALFALLFGFLATGHILTETGSALAGPGDSGEMTVGDRIQNPDQLCMEDLFQLFGSTGGSLNCTANDISVVAATVPNPVTCPVSDGSQSVTFDAELTVLSTAEERLDVGIFFGRNGSALVAGPSDGQGCFVTSTPTGFGDLDGDACGDIDNGDTNPVIFVVQTITLQCLDDDNDGLVDIPTCSSWRIPGKNTECTATNDIFPANVSKCKCENLDGVFNITIARFLTVKKTLSPIDDMGEFNFAIAAPTNSNIGPLRHSDDDTVQVDDSSTPVVPPFAVTITETGNTGTDIDDYSRSAVCTGDGGGGSAIATTVTSDTTTEFAVSFTYPLSETDILCEFTNTIIPGNIVVEKQTDPDGDEQLFTFTPSYGSDFDLADNGTDDSGDLDPGTYSVSETVPSGWDLTSTVCTSSLGGTEVESAIALTAGETVTCVFNNTERGMVDVLKTISGGTPGGVIFEFQVRDGATALANGALLGKCLTDGITGACSILEDPALTDPLKLLPNTTFQFCEVVMPGWSTDLSTSLTPVPFTIPNGGSNDILCVDFQVLPGQTLTFNIDNTPPPGGDPRTIGFWRNWNSCTGGNQDDVLDQTLASAGTISLGALDLIGTSCEDAVNILSKRDTDGKNRANDAAYGMAAQLLAALLNQQAGATICAAANDAIADAEDLLNNALAGATLPTPSFDGMKGHYRQPKGKGKATVKVGDPSTALSLASTLDGYNNGLLCP